MGRSLFWKEKVALISLLFLSVFNSRAQTFSTENITYTCRAARLETVMSFLSKQSGYDFIYSKGIVDVSKPISLTVKDKSINEVLALIERQADVSFKLHERHIVIKSNPKPVSVVLPQRKARQLIAIEPAFESNDSMLITSTSRTIPTRIFDSQATQLEKNLNKRITELQQLLGANVPHNIPKYYVNRINFNNRYNGWYASIGTYVSDNASGLEFQAGLRYLYGVFTPRWSAQHGFYGAYGVGNSLRLSGHFSINTMYVFSGYTDNWIIHHPRIPGYPDRPDTRETDIKRHHQVKLALRYSFNENLSLRAGPVFNYQNKIHKDDDNIEYRQSGNGNSTYLITNQPGITHFSQRWIGWEMSLQYRINFYKKNP